MVSSHLMGGLGNYMFQIAAATSLAIKNDDKAEFYVQGSSQVHKHLTSYVDNIFRNVNIVNKPDLRYIRYIEPGFSYNEIPYSNNLLLHGYFQSEKYFKDSRDEILDMFKPSEEQIEYIFNKYGTLLDLKKTCSIHVRRGNYLKLKEHHPPCDIEYYNLGMSIMEKDTTYLIFSDDISWCKENFVGDQFNFIENENDITDLAIMGYCKNNIIANSSFSWWGAWLNKNDNKIVVAPTKWFGAAKGNINVDDIYAENWIKL